VTLRVGHRRVVVAHERAIGEAACGFLEPGVFEHGCHAAEEIAGPLNGISLDDSRAVLDRELDPGGQQRPGQPRSAPAATDEETHNGPDRLIIERRCRARSAEPLVFLARGDGAPSGGLAIDVCENAGRRGGSIDNVLDRPPVRGAASSSVVRGDPRPHAPAVAGVVSAVHELREVTPAIGGQRMRLNTSPRLRHDSMLRHAPK